MILPHAPHHFITVEKGLFRDVGVGVRERYLYIFLRAILGDSEGVIGYQELSGRSGLRKGTVMRGVKLLEERGYLQRSFLYFRLSPEKLGKKTRLKALCFTPLLLPKKPVFDKNLSPEEKGMFFTLLSIATPEGKIFYSFSAIAKQFFNRSPHSPTLSKPFRSLLSKNYIQKVRFWYVIPDYEKLYNPWEGDNKT